MLSAAADGTGLGLSICFDVRFPELYRALTVAGARILLVPAAFTGMDLVRLGLERSVDAEEAA